VRASRRRMTRSLERTWAPTPQLPRRGSRLSGQLPARPRPAAQGQGATDTATIARAQVDDLWPARLRGPRTQDR
jgi:hypothetical protein